MIEIDRKNRIIEGLKNGDLEFTELSNELQSDRDIAFAAVKKDATVLKFLKSEFKEDENILKAVIKRNC